MLFFVSGKIRVNLGMILSKSFLIFPITLRNRIKLTEKLLSFVR